MVTALIFGILLERYLTPPPPRAKAEPAEREPALPLCLYLDTR